MSDKAKPSVRILSVTSKGSDAMTYAVGELVCLHRMTLVKYFVEDIGLLSSGAIHVRLSRVLVQADGIIPNGEQHPLYAAVRITNPSLIVRSSYT